MNTNIHIADNDASMVEQLKSSLEKKGYTITTSNNGKETLEYTTKEKPFLLIMEASLPEIDGFSVCKTLRADGFNNPVVFFTERTSEIDAVIGFEVGAQDYIRKTVQLNEVLARIESQLKRFQNDSSNRKINISDLEIDLEQRKVKYKGALKDLTHKEFQLLYALAQTPNKVFSRTELLNNVWGWSQYGETRTVDIHIGYLRKKFEEDPRKPKMLQTIRGVGYTLIEDTEKMNFSTASSF